LLRVEYETTPQTQELAVWIADHTDGQRLYVVNPWDQFSTFAMEWYLATHNAPQDLRFEELFVPSERLQSFTPEEAEKLKCKRSGGTPH
jgi:hypothetical protein